MRKRTKIFMRAAKKKRNRLKNKAQLSKRRRGLNKAGRPWMFNHKFVLYLGEN